jgi:outer membrane protein W
MRIRIVPSFAMLLTCLLTLPLFAQNELGIFANHATFRDSTAGPIAIERPKFDSRVGYGISLNRFLSPDMSIQLSGQTLRADVTEPDPIAGATQPELRATFEVRQYAAMLQYHLNPRGTIVPYIGGGLAWMSGGKLNVAPGAGGGVPAGPFHMKDKTTWIADAGIDFRLSRSVALILAGTYSPYAPKFDGSNIGTFQNLKLDPVTVSAGLRLRY